MKADRRKSEFNVLVIEDDNKLFSDLRDALSDTRYRLHRASTAEEALRLIKDGSYIVAITELRLSDLDGLELIRRIKKLDSKTNIIALTAYCFTESAVEALEAGAYAYLTKPLNMKEVKIVLKRAIENTLLFIQAGKRKYYQDISIMDGLTGVFNHRHFHEMLDWSIAHLRRFPQSFSLFMIDIDDFKKYNDKHGHIEGDKVLRDAAKLFIDSTRENDMVFRYGGEEFTIILSQTDQMIAQRIGERLLDNVRRKMPVTISIGLATFPTDAQSKSDLIVFADKALYMAKREGKDRICVFDKKTDE